MDPDPDPAILGNDQQQKLFVAYYILFEGPFTSYFSKIKSHKEVTKQ
jgi:hypothetical protein